mgnify:FL=1
MNIPLIVPRSKLDASIVGRVGENLAAYYLEFNNFE